MAFFNAVLRHPRLLLWLGRLVCATSAALALLGLRVDRLLPLLMNNAGSRPLEWTLPAWVTWAIPETVLGWLCVGVLFATGFCLAEGGVAIGRLTHR